MAFTGPIDRDLTAFVRRLLQKKEDGRIPIVKVGDPVLREPWHEYRGQIDARVLGELVPVMRKTMLDAPGVGLAAPQVGIPLAFAVVEDHLPQSDNKSARGNGSTGEAGSGDSQGPRGERGKREPGSYDWSKDPREFAEFPFHIIINPHYEPIGGRTVSFYEGCLSLPDVEAVRERWHDIHATWQDEKGVKHAQDLHGWPARIFQHETDHLSGEIYLDRAEIRSISTMENMDNYGWNDPATLRQEAKVLGFKLSERQRGE